MKFKDDIVLITGSNGRIGTAVMQRLRERFDNVVGFDRHESTPPPPGCTHIPVDITSDKSLREGLRILHEHHGERIIAVIHLAAYYDFLGKPSPKYDEITVEGTKRLLHGLRDGFQVEQFIFSSTMLVHQPGEPGVFITEESPIGPTWAYPESKVRTEVLIRMEHGAIPVVLLRFAGIYDDVCHSLPLAHQMQRIYERQLASHLYSGETSHGQSFIHLDDVVDVIERTIERRAQLPREVAILIGEPETLSYDELQHTFQRLIHGESWETLNVPAPIAKAGVWLQDQIPGQESFIKPWMIDRANDHYALDITRARTLLDWIPQHSLRETLPKMVSELKADPPSWYREHELELSSSLIKTAELDLAEIPEKSEHEPIRKTDAASSKHEHGEDVDHHPLTRVAESSPIKEYTCPMHPEVVTREPGRCPRCGMALELRTALVKDDTEPTKHMEHAGHGGDMMLENHRNMLWPYYLSMILGLWLLTSPFTLGYTSDFVPDANQLRVMAERDLPSFELRNLMMTWSDVISGILVIVFSVLSADTWRRNPWAQWANAFVGLWLLFAPLVFWTPLPEAYANGTLVGGLVIALAVLIPMMPGMSMAGMMGKPDVPPGWSYTPSSWLQRLPIAVLALLGFFIARILGAYQLGHIDTVWEPFFASSGDMKDVRNGTEEIITSHVSKAWPIADGALGGIVYMAELVMVWMGGKTRWRTMPWMVLALAILILPLGVVSIYFVIIQPIVIGTWCTLCLIATLAMAVMIPYALNEFVAMGQFLVWSRQQGKPFWRTFWTGDAMEGGSADTSKGLTGTPREQIAEVTRGVTYPLTLLLSMAIGVWLTFTRITFDSTGAMADSDHLVGLLVLTFTIIALAEVGRGIRFINIPFGIWLIAAPLLLDGIASPLAIWNGVICGLLLIALTIPRGVIKNSYAGWNRYMAY